MEFGNHEKTSYIEQQRKRTFQGIKFLRNNELKLATAQFWVSGKMIYAISWMADL